MSDSQSQHFPVGEPWSIRIIKRRKGDPIVTFTSPSGVIYPRRISPPLGKTTLLHDILQKGLGNA
ncbi:hypothetical protein AA14337_3155 [Acetobacter malorum DSM 14337]|uniref:Uncharacterized protein n=1 Tax=Acetobacter malorum DSM 14337 TaxID=1307910 RepID=A0ABQ0PZX8_9PROT|nr:hypothetical protein [Acetobacter malorum]KXV05732.1 hypothetical protein AD930_11415 [Acetobacter malorum]GBQ85754.1 hypothetical protein AA14337_3155 [Acetobacter malorum DSM 14337]